MLKYIVFIVRKKGSKTNKVACFPTYVKLTSIANYSAICFGKMLFLSKYLLPCPTGWPRGGFVTNSLTY